MRVYGLAAANVILVVALLGAHGTTWATAQVPKTLTEFGAPAYPAYEGWYSNLDGSFSLLMGYFNPNKKETVEIPIGENNFISPGPADQGSRPSLRLDVGTEFSRSRYPLTLATSRSRGRSHHTTRLVDPDAPPGGVLRRAVQGCSQR